MTDKDKKQRQRNPKLRILSTPVLSVAEGEGHVLSVRCKASEVEGSLPKGMTGHLQDDRKELPALGREQNSN